MEDPPKVALPKPWSSIKSSQSSPYSFYSHFEVKIQEGMAPEQVVSTVVCRRDSVQSTVTLWAERESGLRGGILGLVGVGRIGLKIAKARGHHVTVISSSENKKQEALEHLGADEYVVGSDDTQMKKVADSLYYIIDTVPVAHPLEPYLSLLKVDGKLIIMGSINTPLQFLSPRGRKMITGSFIGGIKEWKRCWNSGKRRG